MPAFRFSAAMTANQQGVNPLLGWQYEYAPWAAAVKVIVNATTVGVRMTIYSGSQTLVEKSPVQGGGVAGVIPAELNTQPDIFVAAAGDRLKIVLDEVLAGTPTFNGIIIIEPL